jgi:hypothetical protein
MDLMTKRVIMAVICLFACLAASKTLAAPQREPLSQTLGQITSPRDRASVRGQVPIEGSATHAQFQKYELHYGAEASPSEDWRPVGGSPFSVPVVQGRLALWDTFVIPDGLYSLRLRIVRVDGNYDEYFVRNIQVVNALPTETPTPEATPTEAPPTPTPAPTPTVIIGVPTVVSPTPRPTETPLPTSVPTATPEQMDLPFQSVNQAACWGAAGTLAVFVGIGLLFAFKEGLSAAFGWLVRRGRESLGGYED